MDDLTEIEQYLQSKLVPSTMFSLKAFSEERAAKIYSFQTLCTYKNSAYSDGKMILTFEEYNDIVNKLEEKY